MIDTQKTFVAINGETMTLAEAICRGDLTLAKYEAAVGIDTKLAH
jgi:hypothetical protein